MKIGLITFLATTCIIIDSFANSSYAQATHISIDVENTTLKEVFREIERNSEFVIFYLEEDVDSNRKVSLKVKNQTVDKVLDKVLAKTNNSYLIDDKQIFITKKDKMASPGIPAVAQQKITVKGVVTDINGEKLPGATVVVEGTPRGAITDIDGTYTIDVNKNEKLTFSYLGMASQTIAVGDKKIINVTLKEKEDMLEEVTIVAFGKQKKESVISSIQTVHVKDLRVPSSNLTTALSGRIAGVISYQTSGEPGQDNAEFFIRGVTSFGAGKVDPLILIDNVEVSSNDLSRLHPDDIQSFSILKDATATALYGARGANGVILVTDNQGRKRRENKSLLPRRKFLFFTYQENRDGRPHHLYAACKRSGNRPESPGSGTLLKQQNR